jgi:acetylornithine/N-succinyldiaminopimelate aminotransferase
LFKQRLAELKDRHPTVLCEVRGEGLLVGLRCVVPNAKLVDAMRAEKMLAPGAADNVVRLLPPLIAGEAEIGEAIARIDRACIAVERELEQPLKQGAAR